jgi:drug/metabolite transporter (DMT)-like permease
MNDQTRGYLFGFLGVLVFSLTLPFTRIAVAELDPLFISLGRTVLAAAAAILVLLATRQAWPANADIKQLLIVAAGVVFGFPICSAIAMQTVPASHGGVVLGALPLATAIMSTIFAGERPSPAFWFWSLAGSLAVIAFTIWDTGFLLQAGDTFLLLALILAGIGYAAGGNLSRSLGGWQVICWALIVALPVTLPATLYLWQSVKPGVSAASWWSFAYLALMSQFLGFFAWNRGLAIGGVSKVGQVQLLQTFLTLGFSALINREFITMHMIAFALIVAACVWFGRRARVIITPAPAAQRQ